jgi:hypothetical protein
MTMSTRQAFEKETDTFSGRAPRRAPHAALVNTLMVAPDGTTVYATRGRAGLWVSTDGRESPTRGCLDAAYRKHRARCAWAARIPSCSRSTEPW